MNVLIVDDELLVRTGLQSLVQWDESSFTLAGTARNGEEALKMVSHTAPVIIVTDITMPVMDGIELMEKVRELGFPAEFIILTSHRDFELARRAISLGAVEYLVKYDLQSDSFLKALHRAAGMLENRGESNLSGSTPLKEESRQDYPYRLFLHLDNGGAILRDRGRGPFTANLTALLNQVAGGGVRVLLDSFQNNTWVYRLSETGEGILSHPRSCERLGKRMAEKLQSIMNISVRILLTETRDSGDAMALLDSCFCRGEAVLVNPAAPDASEDQKALNGLVGRLHRAVDLQRWGDLEELLSLFFARARDSMLPGSKLVPEMRALLRRVEGCAGEDSSELPWKDSESAMTDAVFLESVEVVWRRVITMIRTGHSVPEKLPGELIRVLAYIEEHYREPITLQDVSEIAGKTPSYFSTYFHKHMGISLVDYINRKRIDAACTALAGGNLPIKEVSSLCGFAGEKYFLRVFRHFMACTPSQWKSKNSIPSG